MFGHASEARLLKAFRRAAADVPAYGTLLAEHGVRADDIVDLESYSRRCPLLNKANTFDRFTLEQLSVPGTMANLAQVLTSSGHGGRFAFGLISNDEAAVAPDLIDQAWDATFQTNSLRTLVINCLPMGVGFSSRRLTVATTSVREDMAVALVQAFGHHYQQIVVVGDPLFLKRLTDHASDKGVDWARHRVNVVIGEEIFGEHFRSYLARCLGLDPDTDDGGYAMSSFGVGELGLNLCSETRSTVAVRRACFRSPALAHDLLGAGAEGQTLPMLLAFNPARTFIEAIEPDAEGYGLLTISMLDCEIPLPLLRYQTDDIVRLLDPGQVAEVLGRHGVAVPAALPGSLLALQGRRKELLPNGSHVGVYKDALYADPRIARALTGAFRLVFSGTACTMHVQAGLGQEPPPSSEQALLEAIPSAARPARLVIWPYARFPFGMSLDYERKFTHYVPGESAPIDA